MTKKLTIGIAILSLSLLVALPFVGKLQASTTVLSETFESYTNNATLADTNATLLLTSPAAAGLTAVVRALIGNLTRVL
jgi:hypothetical protein